MMSSTAGLNLMGASSGNAALGAAGGRGVIPGSGRDLAESQSSFGAVLARAAGTGEGQTPEETARTGAEQFVSIALVQPILKQLRESSMAAEPFKANSAERTFRTMYDAEIVQRLVRQTNWPLVDRVARDVLSKKGTPLPAASGGRG